MPRIHETVSGHRIEYEDDEPKLAKFLRRVHTLVEDEHATEDDVIALVYGRENPILDQTIFPERGAVTTEVIKNPVYQVLQDLLFRKRVQIDGTDLDRLAAKFSLTLEAAAARAGVTVDGLRKAIRDRRLPSWIKDGKHFIEPKALDAIEFSTRGPAPKGARALKYRIGHDPTSNTSVRLWTDWDGDLSDREKLEGETHRKWTHAALLTAGAGGKLRLFNLTPAEEENEITFGDFYVRGHFEVTQKVNAPKAAREAWEALPD